ncbi:MAG: prepilin-type N-terminal cleavage/methylation domain-containing protein [Clostridiales bacterium]|nr:prepilin-type N-terminal cleavage/methylation domain-containing protein [Clostridiales bacterium]
MKKTNKGFTIVELIIVIAVIGVLAAILIPAFSNIIEKANAKSALSDARGALATYLANTSSDDAGVTVQDGTMFIVEKAKKLHTFTFTNGQIAVTGTPVEFPAGFEAGTTIPDAPNVSVVVVEKQIGTPLAANPALALIPVSVHIYVPIA